MGVHWVAQKVAQTEVHWGVRMGGCGPGGLLMEALLMEAL